MAVEQQGGQLAYPWLVADEDVAAVGIEFLQEVDHRARVAFGIEQRYDGVGPFECGGGFLAAAGFGNPNARCVG